MGTEVLGMGTGEWGLVHGDVSTMNKQPPFRLGTGWGTGVLGVGTGEWGLIHGDVLQ